MVLLQNEDDCGTIFEATTEDPYTELMRMAKSIVLDGLSHGKDEIIFYKDGKEVDWTVALNIAVGKEIN